MAKSCGIRIGARRFELVALEGSPKKHKVLAAVAGEVPQGDDPIATAAKALREVAKQHRVQVDNVGLAIDTGLAAFRTVHLPFDDRDKTEQVIKFEVESQLPQWNIDDVVVDFHKLSGQGADVQMLVAAVPKSEIQKRIQIAEKAGLEPFEVDLEATATVNAAECSGLLGAERACVLVHVGEESTSVIVVDGGQVRSMRAIHIGALPRPADEAVGSAAEGAEGASESAKGASNAPFDPAQAAARLRRELLRTVSSAHVTHPLDAVYFAGHVLGASLDTELNGVRVEPMRLGSAAEGAQLPQACVAAYGAALARLGDVKMHGSLRREELHFSGKFERLELPLAIAGLLLVTLLGVQLIVTLREMRDHAATHAVWVQSSNGFMVGDLKEGRPGRLRKPSEAIKNYVARIERGEATDQTSYEQLRQIESLLRKEIDQLTKELGQGSDIQQPQSALEGLTLVLELIDGMDDEIGRYSLRALQADYNPGRSGTEDRVTVKLDMSFFGEDDVVASRNYNNFVTTVEAQPWCVEYVPKPSKPFDNGKGISVDSITIVMDLSVIQRNEPKAG